MTQIAELAHQTEDGKEMWLDASKVAFHQDRIEQWKRGERFYPITIDMALSRNCNAQCSFCYATLQENQRHPIEWPEAKAMLDDCAKMGVKAISLVSDGESTLNPIWADFIVYGKSLGIDMAIGTNSTLVTKRDLEKVLPHLGYYRINISAGEPKPYAEIMGLTENHFHKVCEASVEAMKIIRRDNLKCSFGLQMVLMPGWGEQALALAKLGKELGVHYTVIKHCSDDEEGNLGIDYSAYAKMHDILRRSESLSTDEYKVIIKWSKIKSEGKRTYSQCYGTPFHLQISGSGLVAPCGMLFNEKYSKFHIGNFTKQGFKEMLDSERYWEVVKELGSDRFDAKHMCGTLCLQHLTNTRLDNFKKGMDNLDYPTVAKPMNINFI